MGLSRILLALLIVLCGGAYPESRAAAATCRYDVKADPAAGLADLVLDVKLDCDAALSTEDFLFNYGGARFASWTASEGLGYRIELGALARRGRPHDFAATSSGVQAPIDAWLAAPRAGAAADRLEIAFAATPDVFPLVNLERSAGRYLLKREDWDFGGYAVFSDRPPLRASAPGPASFDPPGRPGPATAEIRIARLSNRIRLTDAETVAWIEAFATTTARFWAGFPADRLLIAIREGGGVGRPFGRVRGGGGATMLLRIAAAEELEFLMEQDWVLTHEMIHLGAPFVREATWLMEGMATYLEPLIRSIDDRRDKDLVWREWLRAMPTGALGFNLEGLDGDGHPYWTGALFFLLAHVEAARRGDAQGLAECFREVRRALGGADRRARLGAFVTACDRALGAPALAELRRRHADPVEFDLPALWRGLGVSLADDRIAYADTGRELRMRLFDKAQFGNPRHK